MHEYSLYTQIPSSRYTQVLQLLAGLTASQPTEIREQILIYQQQKLDQSVSKKLPQPKGPGNQAKGLQYVKLVRDLPIDGADGVPDEWRLRAEDVPLPGVSNVISRPVSERALRDGDPELERFRRGGGWYKYINQFLLPGVRYTHSQLLLLRLTRPLIPPEGHGALEALDAPIPTADELKPVDPSGCWLLEAVLRVEDASNSDLVDQARQALASFAKQVEGAIDLRVPERLSLDVRVR